MGCSESRKAIKGSFSEEEVNKLIDYHKLHANQYQPTRGKNDLSLKTFEEIFLENPLLGKSLHSFMIKNSQNGALTSQIFVDILELMCRENPQNEKLRQIYGKYDKIELLCLILIKRIRKEQIENKNQQSVISYIEAFDVVSVLLRMFNEKQKRILNEQIVRSIVDSLFPFNIGRMEWRSFCVLLREYLTLLKLIVTEYFEIKFLQSKTSFHLPRIVSSPQHQSPLLLNEQLLAVLFLNNQYLQKTPFLCSLYQANQNTFQYKQLLKNLLQFQGPTFILLQFEDSNHKKYIIGGFNQQPWQRTGIQGDRESYVFSLSPKYRHFLPIEEITVAYRQNMQYCYLNENKGLCFGGIQKESCRIWLDANNLNDSIVMDDDFNYKPGSLIDSRAENLSCVFVEIIGLQKDVLTQNNNINYQIASNKCYDKDEIKQILQESANLKKQALEGIDIARASAMRLSQGVQGRQSRYQSNKNSAQKQNDQEQQNNYSDYIFDNKFNHEIQNQQSMFYSGVIFAIKEYDDFDFKFQIYNSSKQVIHQNTLNDGHCINVDQQQNTIKWLEYGDKINMYLFKFDKKFISNEINFMIHQCQYEKNNKVPFQKAFKQDEIEYQRRIAEEDEEEINKQYENDNKEYINQQLSVSQNIGLKPILSSNFSNSNKSNVKTLEQSKLYERTYVSKGQHIEVFRLNEDNDNQQLEHLCQLPIVKDLDGESFEPRKILLQSEDTKILILNQQQQKKVYYYDIEKGKTIQEFKCNENTVQDFAPQMKHSQNQCFYGINSKNIFLMDPRKSGGLATSDVVQQSKIYTENNKFSCIQSNDKGNFAIGSEDGSIRLYSEVGKMAKNKFMGFGDPIISIDTSKDLKWILATCKTYLILIPTYSAKDLSKDLYNFKVNYEDRRILKKLTLSQEDLKALLVEQIGFTPAKFNDSQNNLEKYIVSSIGNYTVVWDFQKVIKGIKDCYEISKSSEIIQCAEFKYNSESKLYSASKNKLELQNLFKLNKK